jgi:hypothetical protein
VLSNFRDSAFWRTASDFSTGWTVFKVCSFIVTYVTGWLHHLPWYINIFFGILSIFVLPLIWYSARILWEKVSPSFRMELTYEPQTQMKLKSTSGVGSLADPNMDWDVFFPLTIINLKERPMSITRYQAEIKIPGQPSVCGEGPILDLQYWYFKKNVPTPNSFGRAVDQDVREGMPDMVASSKLLPTHAPVSGWLHFGFKDVKIRHMKETARLTLTVEDSYGYKHHLDSGTPHAVPSKVWPVGSGEFTLPT